jgi:TonB family protein
MDAGKNFLIDPDGEITERTNLPNLHTKTHTMKNYLNIFVAAIILITAQACGSDSKKDEEVSESPVTEVVVPSVEEKRAKLQKEKAERAELRKIENEKLAKLNPTYTDAKGNVVFIISEVSPAYNGGDDAMMKFLEENVQFPKEAEDKNVEGTVFVDFIVAANGIVREVEVTDETNEDVDSSFRTEAMRVVSSMPAWIPGRQHGKAVDVKFSIPITFQMI